MVQAVNITHDGVIEYYGNRAGYIKDNTAFVDVMFQKDELLNFLQEQGGVSVTWREGVYDLLVSGVQAKETSAFKNCRIYQLKPTVDVRMKFISYDALQKHGFGSPDIKNYNVVYDGNIGTNDLEKIYSVFNLDTKPEDYSGYSLSVSDIIELYDENGSEFHYVDSVGFVRIEPDLAQEKEQSLQAEDGERLSESQQEEPLGLEAQEDVYEENEVYEEKEAYGEENDYDEEAFDEENDVEQSEDDHDMWAETFTIIM